MLPSYTLRGWAFDGDTRMWYGYRFDVGAQMTWDSVGDLVYVKETEFDREFNTGLLRPKDGDVVVIGGEVYTLDGEFGQ